MPASGTGSEVLAYCGSCKMDLSAVIVAQIGSKIAKVQCKTCKKEHAYKGPKGAKEPSKAAIAKKKKSAEAAEAAESARAVSFETEWKRLMGEAEKAPRVSYTIKSQLKVGDVIKHTNFGDGIVTRLIHPDKAEVLFRTDMKLLIHSRS
ncbi:MAG: hypothetical protein AB1540_14805 [Bdellovibrionota bacterium]